MTSHPGTGPRRSGLTRLLTLSNLLWLGVLLTVSQAQITLDGSLGPQGALTGPHYRIDANMGQTRGSNLFHSFGEFNVPTGASATFTGPNTIANIVGRVTGGQVSSIDGLLRSEIAEANLYLLNPSGVLFGPNAALDVSGSVHVSTADFLRLADGAKFSAHLSQESMLTVASPTAFGFLGTNPAAIAIQGSSLQVLEGKALSVVGGDVQILRGALMAPSGRIQLASVASPGEVAFSPLELAPDLHVHSFTRLGRLELSHGGLLDVSGESGGTVLIRGGQLLVDQAFILADTGDGDRARLGVDLQVTADAVLTNGALITTNTSGAGRAGALRLTAGSLHVDNAFIVSNPGPFASGDGGDITVHVGRLTLLNGAQIDNSTLGEGHGGQLTVTATEAISIAGPDSGLFNITLGSGDAGRIVVSAPVLRLTERGTIEAVAWPETQGHAGDIEIRAGNIVLTGGAQIGSSTFGAGRGGAVSITATEALAIAGRDPEGERKSGLFSNTFGGGDAGRLVVSAPSLTLDGGLIQAGSSPESRGHAGGIEVHVGRLALTGGAEISASTFGRGRGGTLIVAAGEDITIAGRNREGQRSGLFSITRGSGEGGDVLVAARHVQLHEGGQIAARSTGDGAAGRIRIQAGETFRSEQGGVTAAATGAGGGAIVLQAGRLVQLRDSELTTSVQGGGSDAGNLTLDAPFVILDGSQVVANAFEGTGGNIRIGAEVFLRDPASRVDASALATLGISGSVEIQAPVTSLSGTLAPLPQAFVSAVALLPARCAARLSEGQASSLVLGGRDGLPPEPGGLLSSPLILGERLMTAPALTGAPHRRKAAARFVLLTGPEKSLPRLGCPK
jgi:filamentous hemagglutinin family protein